MNLRNSLIAFALLLTATATGRAQDPTHYRLARSVFRVEASSSPLVRVQCVVRAKDGKQDAVVFDPNDATGLVRYALLPEGTESVQLECSSDRFVVDGKATAAYSFAIGDFGPASAATGKLLTISGDKAFESHELSMTAIEAGTEESAAALDALTGIEPVTRLRSLELSTLVTHLLSGFAVIALEGAQEAGKQYAREYLQEHLCRDLTVKAVREHLAGSVLSREINNLGWASDRPLLDTTCALLATLRLDELASARDALWKALSADAAQLAMAIVKGAVKDVVAPGESSATAPPSALPALVEAAGTMLRQSLSRNGSVSERDVQVLVLALGRVGLQASPDAGAGWQCALESGMAVLRVCLRDNSCPADELGRLLTQEMDARPTSKGCIVKDALQAWPELPTLLGRIGDVLQPPPGTPAKLTAANAFEVVLAVAEHVLLGSKDAPPVKRVLLSREFSDQLIKAGAVGNLTENLTCEKDGEVYECSSEKLIALLSTRTPAGEQQQADNADVIREFTLAPGSARHAYTLSMLRTLRAFMATMRGEDPALAVTELGMVLKGAIQQHCFTAANGNGGDGSNGRTRKAKKCKVPVTEAQLDRALSVLAAVASYGASYRDGVGEESSEEIAQARAEERKKALETLIAAFTNRAHRRGEWVVALGTNVAMGTPQFVVREEKRLGANLNPLSLTLGPALQYLPAPLGFHLGLTVLDLSQYLTVATNPPDKEDSSADPSNPQVAEFNLASAVNLGGQVGMLFGSPSFPANVSINAGYIPFVEYDHRTTWEFRLGLSLGVYVPFFDFN